MWASRQLILRRTHCVALVPRAALQPLPLHSLPTPATKRTTWARTTIRLPLAGATALSFVRSDLQRDHRSRWTVPITQPPVVNLGPFLILAAVIYFPMRHYLIEVTKMPVDEANRWAGNLTVIFAIMCMMLDR